MTFCKFWGCSGTPRLRVVMFCLTYNTKKQSNFDSLKQELPFLRQFFLKLGRRKLFKSSIYIKSIYVF
jgi:hypothetical protein